MAEHIALDELLERLTRMPSEELDKLRENTDQIVKGHGMMRWQPNPGSQTEAYFCDAFEIGYGGEAGPGKGLSLNTLLPTPSGFVAMGDVQVGDELIDMYGN